MNRRRAYRIRLARNKIAACAFRWRPREGSTMNVAAILRRRAAPSRQRIPQRRCWRWPINLPPSASAQLSLLATKGTVAGIVSERDIIRALSTQGPECLTRPVLESMTRQVITCQETDTLDELMAMMTERRFRHLPVITDHALVGIISIGDVVKHHVADEERPWRPPRCASTSHTARAGWRALATSGVRGNCRRYRCECGGRRDLSLRLHRRAPTPGARYLPAVGDLRAHRGGNAGSSSQQFAPAQP